jgi:hypothetical protein
MAYFNQDIETLKKLYIDYLQHLTFERDVHIQSLRTEDEKRLAELEVQNKELQEEMQSVKA